MGCFMTASCAGLVFCAAVAAEETSATNRSAVTFEADVQPLLTRFGCNSGPCHGKSRGQNGFALSLFGFDSDFDFAAITRDSRGRRLFPAAPEESLLLQKPTGRVPHGGGVRFDVDTPHYELLRAWIEAGVPRKPANAPQFLRVVMDPLQQTLTESDSVPLRVFAEYSDGTRRDVTDGCTFQSNDPAIATVSPDGVAAAGPVPGESAILARYVSHIAVCRVAVPLPGQVPEAAYVGLPVYNEIDALVWKNLQRLGMLPSERTDDAKFLRRAHLRAIGRLPSPEEATRFLADTEPDKRARLVDELLTRPEYGDFWANKWADLLRPNPYRTGIKAVWTLDAYLRQSFRDNKPYDQFVRELLTAQGSTWHNGATVIYRDRPLTVEIGSLASQLFLGVRLECAKCHHHPFEVWSQDDFYGFAAFFARVGHNGGLSPPISGGEELIFTLPSGDLQHGRTGSNVLPQVLQGTPLTIGPDRDPREDLAEWMTDRDNPYFAKVMANRIWSEIMGRGLVEPVDDLRATNPSSNESLLEFLAAEFRSHSYDIKQLIATIMKSHVFELSSTPVPRNISDQRGFARYYRQRLRAEVLLDAVNDILGTQEQLAAMPPGSRATQMWTHRSSSLFLETFGRPDPNQDPPCERTSDSTTPQILHLMNSPELNQKLSSESARPAQLAASELSNQEIAREVYLRVYSRPPTDDEMQTALAILPETDRRAAVEDLFWALLNTPEFLFID